MRFLNHSIFLLFFLLSSFNINASTWLNKSSFELETNFQQLKKCNINIKIPSAYPLSFSKIYSQVLIDKENKNKEKCKKNIEFIVSYLEEEMIKTNGSLIIQSESPNFLLQNNFGRLTKNFNSAFLLKGYQDSLSYEINFSNVDGKYRFDESSINFYGENNLIFSVSRKNNWWSPSNELSLILSNQARPFPMISMENNQSQFLPFLSFLGPINYKLFLGKLESDRHIPNAKILGFRMDFFPNNKFQWSFFRTAQFGGRGRPENLETLFNLTIGRDNIGESGINFSNEPGNQLAGVDFKISLDKDFRYQFFSQIVGEDEAGYLPSRVMYLFGFSYQDIIRNAPLKITIEHSDTESSSKIINYSYSHFIYKDGYRYYKKPLGASVDADSKITLLTFHRNVLKGNFYLRFFNSKINKNNNVKNVWGPEPFQVDGLEISRNYEFNRNYDLSLKYFFHKKKYESFTLDEEKIVISFKRNFIF